MSFDNLVVFLSIGELNLIIIYLSVESKDSFGSKCKRYFLEFPRGVVIGKFYGITN